MSGNTVNGLEEDIVRRPSRFVWHPPERQTHGDLPKEVTDFHRRSAEVRIYLSPQPPGGRGPAPIEWNPDRVEKSAPEWSALIKAFALYYESDLVGIAKVDPDWVDEGYEINGPWVIMIGVAMD